MFWMEENNQVTSLTRWEVRGVTHYCDRMGIVNCACKCIHRVLTLLVLTIIMVVFTSPSVFLPTWAPSSHHSQNKLSSPQSGCISLEANHYNFSLWLRQKKETSIFPPGIFVFVGVSHPRSKCFKLLLLYSFLQLRWSQCTQVVGAVTRCHNVIKVLRVIPAIKQCPIQ